MLPKIKNEIYYEFVVISFIPAVLILITKVISMFLLSYLFNIDYNVSSNGILYQNIDDFIYLNNISNLISFIVVFSVSFWYLIKAYFLHESHISPKFSIWLAVQDLSHLVSDSMGIYLRLLAYGFFVWVYVFIIGLWAIIGLGSFYVFYICAGLAIIYTVLATLDLERDYLIHLNVKRQLF